MLVNRWLSNLVVVFLVLVACGGGAERPVAETLYFGDRSISEFVQREMTSAQVEQIARDKILPFRKLEVAEFGIGTNHSQEISVVTEPDQPLFAYAFLPTSVMNAYGAMVLVQRDTGVIQAVWGFDCAEMGVFLGMARITDFTNEFCPGE